MKQPVKHFLNQMTFASLSISMASFLSAEDFNSQIPPQESRKQNVSVSTSQTQENTQFTLSAISDSGTSDSGIKSVSSAEAQPASPDSSPLPQIPTPNEIQNVWLSLRSQIAPALVRLETTGGTEKTDGVNAILETTGLMIDTEGFIFSTAAAFAHQPDVIIAVTNTGKRFPARIVSTDFIRKIVLLKIEVPQDFSEISKNFQIPSAANIQNMRVGQKIAAFGKVLSSETPSITTGIVSGKNRHRGTAVQINAHVSPNNYGGPVVDLDGSVIGILTPFGMGENKLMTGTELYDSGIGFAIPLEDLFALLERMKRQPELRPAPKLGIVFTNPAAFLAEPRILHVEANSIADNVGLRPEDLITHVNNVPISTGTDFRRETVRYFEGDLLKLTIARENKTFQKDILLEDLAKKKEK